ncbi:MAG: hypothetical protein ACLSHJ_09810 [Oscillospiraceae bacterium]
MPATLSEERAEHEADDLRTDVLHLGGAVQAAGARGVAQEAGDTEAHVGGVAHRRENEGGKADGHAREDDTPMDLFHFLHSLFFLSRYSLRKILMNTV